jgi:chromosome segregation ATPase
MLQQESMEINRRSFEQEPKQGSGRSTTMEEEEMQEVIDHLHKQLKERNETNASLTATIKKQQEQLDVLNEKKSNSKENEANKEKINEMKGIIQDLQVKLQDKNNTNGALVRSAKMQSETIASLRSELKTLRTKEAQVNQESMEELRRKDEIISQLRQELITISQAFNSREGELSGSGEESDDEFYSNSGLIGNQTLDVVQEEGSETSFSTR